MGIFDFFKKQPVVEASSGPMIAMIALSSAVLPDANKLGEFLKAYWPDTPPIEDASVDSQTMTFHVGGALAAVSLMPAPIPWTELEGPCATAWYWPEATQALKEHKYHLLVVLAQAPLDTLDASLLLTKLVAAVAASVDADGIYWGAGSLVHSTEMFVEQAKEMSRESLPLYLWIDFRMQKEEADKFTLVTTGMQALEFMEIEIVKSEKPPQALIEIAFNIAHYLLDNGPVLKDGNSIGLSADDKTLVRHLPSIWEDSRTVYRLEC